MQFLNDIYEKLSDLVAQIENFNVGGFFIGLVIAIAAIFLIIALCTIGNKASKLKGTSKKISKYIAETQDGIIDENNVDEFEAKCIAKAPKTIKLQWAAFMEQRFGYPSEFISEKACYKRPKILYAREFGVSLFNAILVILIGAYFVLGLTNGELQVVLTNSIYAIIAGAILSFILVLIGRINVNGCLKAFYKMQDDLDTAVMIQDLKVAEPSNETLSTASKQIEEVIGGAVAKYPKGETEEDYHRGVNIVNNIYVDRPPVTEQPAQTEETIVTEAVSNEGTDYIEGLYDDDETEVLADEVIVTDTNSEYIEGVYDDDDVATLEDDEEDSNFPAAEGDEETIADSAEVEEEVSETEEESEPEDKPEEEPESKADDFAPTKPEEEKPAVEPEKPPKFAKLPPFMAYLLTTHTKKSTYIAITRVLIGAYFSTPDPRDKIILKNSLYTMLQILTRPEFRVNKEEADKEVKENPDAGAGA
ncbi:MAG: hypothetical protein LBT55_05365 [Clostridiaceae bacterium]|jgi:hypothetical protein|nr:hypothetical protein [Clostridiaceae bacterium]